MSNESQAPNEQPADPRVQDATQTANGSTETITTIPQPQTIVIQQTRAGGSLLRVISLLGLFGFAFYLMFVITQLASFSNYTSGGITEHFHSGATIASDKVVIINISGLIADGKGFVKQQIDQVRDDKDVKAVVIRVNSPGGTVTASDYMFHHLTKLREEKDIPFVVSMGSIAASGGYYVAMAVGDQEQSIYAEPFRTMTLAV